MVEHATGTRDMDRLGGLIRRLPRTAVITFIGTLGIAALPPLNGFVSEWLIFQGLFQGFRTGSHLVGDPDRARRGHPGPDRWPGHLRVRPRLRHPVPRHAAHQAGRATPARPASRSAGPALLAVACVALARRRPGRARCPRPRDAHRHRRGVAAGAAARESHRDPGPHRTSPGSRRPTWRYSCSP